MYNISNIIPDQTRSEYGLGEYFGNEMLESDIEDYLEELDATELEIANSLLYSPRYMEFEAPGFLQRHKISREDFHILWKTIQKELRTIILVYVE